MVTHYTDVTHENGVIFGTRSPVPTLGIDRHRKRTVDLCRALMWVSTEQREKKHLLNTYLKCSNMQSINKFRIMFFIHKFMLCTVHSPLLFSPKIRSVGRLVAATCFCCFNCLGYVLSAVAAAAAADAAASLLKFRNQFAMVAPFRRNRSQMDKIRN